MDLPAFRNGNGQAFPEFPTEYDNASDQGFLQRGSYFREFLFILG